MSSKSGVSVFHLPNRSPRLEFVGCWFLYVAAARMDRTEAIIKVGISEVPADRIAQVSWGSPFPIEFAVFASAGKKGAALRVERSVLSLFSEYRTRGEWLRVPRCREFRQLFQKGAQLAMLDEVGYLPKWRTVARRELHSHQRQLTWVKKPGT